MIELLIFWGVVAVVYAVAKSGSKRSSDSGQPDSRPEVPNYGVQQPSDVALQHTLTKGEANREFRKSLLIVHKGIDADCELAEIHAQIIRECADPIFARIFEEMGKDMPALQPIFLSKLEVASVDSANLTECASVERIEMLHALLDRIRAVQRRLALEPIFRKGMENIPVDQPYSSYLADQVCLAEAHLALLVPQMDAKSLPVATSSVAPLTVPRTQDPARVTAQPEQTAVGQPQRARPISSASALSLRGLKPARDLVWAPTEAEARAHELQREVESRRIKYLVHFTRVDNLSRILTHGLCSKNEAWRQGVQPLCNDAARYDGQLDGISLSVSFPNYRMLYKYRCLTEGSDWVVLRLSPRIIWEMDCAFYWTNAADNRVRHRNRVEFSTPQAFRDMFTPPEGRRDDWLSPFDPSDDQAEVMVYDTVAPTLIEAVVFETEATMVKGQEQLRGIPGLLASPGCNYFATRKQAKSF